MGLVWGQQLFLIITTSDSNVMESKYEVYSNLCLILAAHGDELLKEDFSVVNIFIVLQFSQSVYTS